MRVRSAALFALTAVVAAGSLAPASAATKKKPLKGSYSLTLAPLPDATEATGCESAARQDGVHKDDRDVKVAGPGVLTVKVTGFVGDWDLVALNAAGATVGTGAGTSTPNASADPQTETMKYKSKKAQTITIRVCNFLGGPTANVAWTYVYN